MSAIRKAIQMTRFFSILCFVATLLPGSVMAERVTESVKADRVALSALIQIAQTKEKPPEGGEEPEEEAAEDEDC